jgi:hypothetical protein
MDSRQCKEETGSASKDSSVKISMIYTIFLMTIYLQGLNLDEELQ